MIIRTRSPWWRRAPRTLGRLMFRLAENNDEARLDRNGERWLLGELLRAHAATGAARPFVLFDAGANAGDYTRAALEEARRAGCTVDVHAFEPSPVAAAGLRRAFAANPAVRILEVALANRAGEALLHAGGSGSSHASLAMRASTGAAPADAVRVRVERLEDYLDHGAVSRVDLLKLDVEGSELAALEGLGGRLRPEIIDVIQFEYGGTSRDAGTSLRALASFLSARGFRIAKLFPRALEVRPYREWMDNFAYANYVALAQRWMPSGAPAPSPE